MVSSRGEQLLDDFQYLPVVQAAILRLHGLRQFQTIPHYRWHPLPRLFPFLFALPGLLHRYGSSGDLHSLLAPLPRLAQWVGVLAVLIILAITVAGLIRLVVVAVVALGFSPLNCSTAFRKI